MPKPCPLSRQWGEPCTFLLGNTVAAGPEDKLQENNSNCVPQMLYAEDDADENLEDNGMSPEGKSLALRDGVILVVQCGFDYPDAEHLGTLWNSMEF